MASFSVSAGAPIIGRKEPKMDRLKAKQAWAVEYDPQYFLQMGEEYDDERLEQLNEYLAKGDYALVSDDTQGFAGDMVIDFALNQEFPYRALIMLEKKD